MEIKLTNKKLLQLASLNNAQAVRPYSYSDHCKIRFYSLNNYGLIKSILYVEANSSNWILEQRR